MHICLVLSAFTAGLRLGINDVGAADCQGAVSSMGTEKSCVSCAAQDSSFLLLSLLGEEIVSLSAL